MSGVKSFPGIGRHKIQFLPMRFQGKSEGELLSKPFFFLDGKTEPQEEMFLALALSLYLEYSFEGVVATTY